ncbi:MAG: DNA-directed RNA polymerase subunit H [Thermoplasmata archaeon]|nr:MAG: DNA-directed RNA polymerase subunit H [Thermoplasmata archaeon]
MVKTTENKHQFDILKHELVPHHEILSDEEKKQLIEKYNLTPDQLPKILDSDPVSVSIGAKPGQIVKIIRKSHTAKEAVAYRLVVESN